MTKMTKILSDKYPLLLILHLARLSSSCDLVTCTYTSQYRHQQAEDFENGFGDFTKICPGTL